MNLVGLMPVRNEECILGLSARVALLWCDRLVILNHASTDGTLSIIGDLQREFGPRILCIEEKHEAWAEMQHRQRMLEWARANVGEFSGATHIAMIDADEILTGNLITGIREHIAALSLGQMLTLPLYNLRGGSARYHLNGVWGQRTVDVAFKDVNTAAWKGDKQHSRRPDGVNWNLVKAVKQGEGGVLHLWGVSERRLRAKHALYKVNEILKPVDRRDYKTVADIERTFSWAINGDTQPPYAHFGTPDTWTFGITPDSWWAPYNSFSRGRYWVQYWVHADAWQENEVRRLVAEHGRETFAGLDLFGIV